MAINWGESGININRSALSFNNIIVRPSLGFIWLLQKLWRMGCILYLNYMCVYRKCRFTATSSNSKCCWRKSQRSAAAGFPLAVCFSALQDSQQPALQCITQHVPQWLRQQQEFGMECQLSLELSGCLCKTTAKPRSYKRRWIQGEISVPILLCHSLFFCNAIQTFTYKYFMCKI